MKILFIGGLQSGGAERQMTSLAREFKQKGFDVHYLYSVGSGTFFLDEIQKANVVCHCINVPYIISALRLSIPFLYSSLVKIIKKENFDVVISFLGMWNFINCKASKKFHRSFLAITGLRNNRADAMVTRRHKFYMKYEKYAFCKVSNSENAKQSFLKIFPEYEGKLVTIYNMVNIPKTNSIYSIRCDNKVNIIVPASYRDVKNAKGLVEALRLMDKKQLERIKIHWYGSIDKVSLGYYSELKELVIKYELADTLVLNGATNDIVNRINESDVVALFSKSEGLPNAICEGMMLSKPIIMTRVSDYKIIIDDDNGVLCDSNDPFSIKDALVRYGNMENSQLIAMGKASRNRAEILFSRENVMKQWIDLISK